MSKCDRGFHSCCVAFSVLAGLLTNLNDFVNFEKKYNSVASLCSKTCFILYRDQKNGTVLC